MAESLPTRRIGCERRGSVAPLDASGRFLRRLLPSCPAFGEEVDVRIWVAWGGGAARRWAGEIRIDRAQSPTPGGQLYPGI